MKHSLTLGPILFNWQPETWRDFYYQVADEAPVSDVYIGEVVCSKRQPFIEPHIEAVAARLKKGGKKVIFSSLALVMNKRESGLTADLSQQDDELVEANDMSALLHLSGKPHVIGPFINVYHEATLAHFAKLGAVRFCLPQELPATSLKIMAAAAKKHGAEAEVQVYGRAPLALSGRCYHARIHHMSKDSCQYTCAEDPDGLALKTLDGKQFLAVNGVQTLSHSYLNLVQNLDDMKKMGIARFRLSPQTQNMLKVINTFDLALRNKIESKEAQKKLEKLLPTVDFSNGFYNQEAGHMWQRA